MSIVLVLALTLAPGASSAAAESPDAELARGIHLVEQGEYAQAIIVLDAVAQRLDKSPPRKKDAAQAYLHLGIAYVAEGQENLATTSFQKALARDAQLNLGAFDVSPKVREVFEKARREMAAAGPKKKGSKLPFVIGGIAVTGAAVGAATAATGLAEEPPTLSLELRTHRGQTCSEPCELVLLTEAQFFAITSGTPGGAPTLTWDFGDGTTLSGSDAFVRHVYRLEGTYTVVVTLSHEGRSARVQKGVTVRSLSGIWDGENTAGPRFVATLTQAGESVAGTLDDGGALGGRMSTGGLISWSLACPRSADSRTFTGQAESTRRITGFAALPCGAPASNVTLTRR
jgi:hypothetical protein